MRLNKRMGERKININIRSSSKSHSFISVREKSPKIIKKIIEN